MRYNQANEQLRAWIKKYNDMGLGEKAAESLPALHKAWEEAAIESAHPAYVENFFKLNAKFIADHKYSASIVEDMILTLDDSYISNSYAAKKKASSPMSKHEQDQAARKKEFIEVTHAIASEQIALKQTWDDARKRISDIQNNPSFQELYRSIQTAMCGSPSNPKAAITLLGNFLHVHREDGLIKEPFGKVLNSWLQKSYLEDARAFQIGQKMKEHDLLNEFEATLIHKIGKDLVSNPDPNVKAASLLLVKHKLLDSALNSIEFAKDTLKKETAWFDLRSFVTYALLMIENTGKFNHSALSNLEIPGVKKELLSEFEASIKTILNDNRSTLLDEPTQLLIDKDDIPSILIQLRNSDFDSENYKKLLSAHKQALSFYSSFTTEMSSIIDSEFTKTQRQQKEYTREKWREIGKEFVHNALNPKVTDLLMSVNPADKSQKEGPESYVLNGTESEARPQAIVSVPDAVKKAGLGDADRSRGEVTEGKEQTR